MDTTIVASEANVVPSGGSSVQDIPLERIRESTTNPRRVFDETKLREFADNIGLHGVLQQILARPAPGGEAGMYELAAGARRSRASKSAAKSTIPSTARDLIDSECREIQLIENLQREGIHELDEGLGYRWPAPSSPICTAQATVLRKLCRRKQISCGRLSDTE
jgi:ParB/RepB/Spo0J family partition protein